MVGDVVCVVLGVCADFVAIARVVFMMMVSS